MDVKWICNIERGDGLFRGENFHNLDDKWRMIIPFKFRDALSDRFIITKGLDRCLFVFTLTE
ncbi:MAG: hypothetical protein LBS19_08620, partial [Clostridiales bacterium]|nr:hypothetical protein [Clostridiales bacterium]